MFAVWLMACVAAGYVFMAQDFRPGQLGTPQAVWPTDSALSHAAGRLTAVAFLHPRCVCSNATIHQLVRTMRDRPDVSTVIAVFVPEGSAVDRAWDESRSVRELRASLPQASIVRDPGGAEARRFGAWTSGTIVVYDGTGREVFRGGITGRRGGEDENPGRQRLVRSLTGAIEPASGSGPVFGCQILAESGVPGAT
jgi:hypothetical protein